METIEFRGFKPSKAEKSAIMADLETKKEEINQKGWFHGYATRDGLACSVVDDWAAFNRAETLEEVNECTHFEYF